MIVVQVNIIAAGGSAAIEQTDQGDPGLAGYLFENIFPAVGADPEETVRVADGNVMEQGGRGRSQDLQQKIVADAVLTDFLDVIHGVVIVKSDPAGMDQQADDLPVSHHFRHTLRINEITAARIPHQIFFFQQGIEGSADRDPGNLKHFGQFPFGREAFFDLAVKHHIDEILSQLKIFVLIDFFHVSSRLSAQWDNIASETGFGNRKETESAAFFRPPITAP